ncbi:MAG: hypothetical protein IJR14_00850 [Synergistaceae bacterium]|nr:hypothetical protein [Synergistaceae bacterium]
MKLPSILEQAEERGIALGRDEGIALGTERGIAEGRREGLIVAARRMKAMGLTPEQIAQATDLSPAAIEGL